MATSFARILKSGENGDRRDSRRAYPRCAMPCPMFSRRERARAKFGRAEDEMPPSAFRATYPDSIPRKSVPYP
jgi:hypothetical protein